MLRTGKLYKLVHLLISLALFAGLALTPTQPAYAATYTVNSLEDTNDGLCGGSDCTLREAIIRRQRHHRRGYDPVQRERHDHAQFKFARHPCK